MQIFDTEIPFDIDTHLIPVNERVGMPEHYHFDFRYLFLVQKISEIDYDKDEFKNYKWITLEEMSQDKNFVNLINKLNNLLKF